MKRFDSVDRTPCAGCGMVDPFRPEAEDCQPCADLRGRLADASHRRLHGQEQLLFSHDLAEMKLVSWAQVGDEVTIGRLVYVVTRVRGNDRLGVRRGLG